MVKISEESKGVYAGSFDPPTNGHLWMIRKGSDLFDELVVAIGVNPEKKYTFSMDEREEMLRDITNEYENVDVSSFGEEYVVKYSQKIDADYILRGIRNEEDFGYENKWNKINRDLDPETDMVYMMPPRELSEVSSSVVKDLVGPKGWEGFVNEYVPEKVWKEMLNEFSDLAESWNKACEDLKAEGDPMDVFTDLVKSYTEPHRHYHDLSHVKHCLNEFEDVKELSQNPEAVEMAIWFHDAIYNPKKDDNEKESAKLAEKELRELGLSQGFRQKTKELILDTDHSRKPDTENGELIVDIDLSILGQENDKFTDYQKGIRKEYDWVSEKQFEEKRSEILKGFLGRDHIFQTNFFRDKYEKKARANLKSAIKELQDNE